MIEQARIRHAIGGRSFLSRGSLLLLVPTSLLTSLLARGASGPAELLGWSLANLLAFLACWGLVELFDRTVFRSKAVHPVAIPGVVAFGAGLGAFKALATSAAGAALGFGELVVLDLAWRSAETAVIGAVAIPAVAALQVAVERYRDEHALLVAQVLERMEVASDVSLTGATTGSSTVHAFVADARRRIAHVEPRHASTTIQQLIDEHLRPFTHELWASGEAPPATLDLRTMLRIALLRNPFPLAGVVLPYTLSILPVSVQLAGGPAGVVRALVAGLSLLVVLALGRLLRPDRAGPVIAVTHLAAILVAATVVQVWQWDRFLGGLPRASTPGLWITVAIWIAVLVVVSGAVSGALRTRAAVRDQVLRVLGPDALREVARQDHDRMEAQRLATRLHGDLQGRMVAAARRIERLMDDEPAIEDELRVLDELLGELSDVNVPAHGSLGQRLEELRARWHGFVTLDVVVQVDGRTLSPRQLERSVEVVSEAVVNAARHGLATHVRVTVGADAASRTGSGGVVLLIEDDGIGPRDGRPGLGTSYFAMASAGEWSLAPRDTGGSLLTVHLPD